MPENQTTPTIIEPLWGAAEIAIYYGRGLRHAYRIIKTPGFPPPVQGDAHRWVPAQVRAWAEGNWQPDPPVAADPTVLRPRTTPTERIVRRRAA
jgi:hypothetical protein